MKFIKNRKLEWSIKYIVNKKVIYDYDEKLDNYNAKYESQCKGNILQ